MIGTKTNSYLLTSSQSMGLVYCFCVFPQVYNQLMCYFTDEISPISLLTLLLAVHTTQLMISARSTGWHPGNLSLGNCYRADVGFLQGLLFLFSDLQYNFIPP